MPFTAASESEGELKFWGPWESLILTLAAIAVGFVAGLLTYFLIKVAVQIGESGSELPGSRWAFDSDLMQHIVFGVSKSVFIVVMVLMIIYFVRLKNKNSMWSYFSLFTVPARIYVDWIIVITIIFTCFTAISFILTDPNATIISEKTSGYLYNSFELFLFVLFSVLLVPILEEMVFRGFLFIGLERSRLGADGAIAVTALLWSLSHIGADVYFLVETFLIGVVLGVARVRTNSLYVPISMHMAYNIYVYLAELAYLHLT